MYVHLQFMASIIMNALECRTLTTTCMHDSMCVYYDSMAHYTCVCLLPCTSAPEHGYGTNLGVGEGTWLCHYIN